MTDKCNKCGISEEKIFNKSASLKIQKKMCERCKLAFWKWNIAKAKEENLEK